MTLDMYHASIPAFVRMLGNLSSILDKGAAHAIAKNIDQSILINARLAPDMYPLSKQVQIATDMVKGCGARLAGLDIPSYEDNETTFTDLQDRIAKTMVFLQSISPVQINGSEERTVTLNLRGKEISFLGQPYLVNFVLPSLYFHSTTAYAILRHNGVELGKLDFLGGYLSE